LELSAIAAGTGGFVISGESMRNHSKFSVSSAGDVNGDGLDDLIRLLKVTIHFFFNFTCISFF
jgi:hypothetical protein